eukprot:47253_1
MQKLLIMLSMIYLAECDLCNDCNDNIDALINGKTSTNRRNLLNTNYGTWNNGTTELLPRPSSYSVVGTYNDTIYIFGGKSTSCSKQLVQFDVTSKHFIDIGQNAFTFNIWGHSQCYTQINQTTLYWIDVNSGVNIIKYNLQTNILTQNTHITIPHNVGSHGCLTSHNYILYVLGGYNSTITWNTIYSYNISSQTWEYQLPSMQTPRRSFSCIVNPMNKILYAIAGHDNNDFLQSIERISIINIKSNNWIYTNQNLSKKWAEIRAVVWNENVLLIGGYNINNQNTGSVCLLQMLLINATNDEIYPVGNLNYSVAGAATVLVSERLYAFAGYVYNSATTKWQYLDLPTNAPTAAPSDHPTLTPTNLPTPAPTQYPMSSPSHNPSPTPTTQPTVMPTEDPTLTPSNNPSVLPTTTDPTLSIPTTSLPT